MFQDTTQQTFPITTLSVESQPPVQYLPQPVPVKLPPKWKSAKDAEGRTYYYHVKTRISQWEPPQAPVSVLEAVESESSSTSSDDENEDENENEEEESDSSEAEEKVCFCVLLFLVTYMFSSLFHIFSVLLFFAGGGRGGRGRGSGHTYSC